MMDSPVMRQPVWMKLFGYNTSPRMILRDVKAAIRARVTAGDITRDQAPDVCRSMRMAIFRALGDGDAIYRIEPDCVFILPRNRGRRVKTVSVTAGTVECDILPWPRETQPDNSPIVLRTETTISTFCSDNWRRPIQQWYFDHDTSLGMILADARRAIDVVAGGDGIAQLRGNFLYRQLKEEIIGTLRGGGWVVKLTEWSVVMTPATGTQRLIFADARDGVDECWAMPWSRETDPAEPED
jgi:hypothetical protein